MGMTFGGEPCQCPRKIAQYLSRDSAFTIMRDWYGQANRYTCPLGAEPGRGLILLKKSQIDRLNFDDNETFDLVVSDQLRRITLPSMHPVRSYCITPGSHNDENRIFAVEFADKRYYFYQKFTNAAYNVKRAPDHTGATDYITETKNAGTAWTWDELGSDLWTDLNWGSTWPGWPFTPDGTPMSWHFWQVPSIVALQVVARRLGCSLRFNPFDSTLDIVRLGTDDTSFEASVDAFKSRDILWDEDWQEPYKPIVPDYVRVVFRRLLAEATGNPYEIKDVTFPVSELWDYAKTGTYAMVIDDLVYTGSNGTARDDRATERADDYARIVEAFNTRLYRHYRGVGTVNDLFLGSLCTQVSWQDVGEGVHTVVERNPLPEIVWSDYLHGVGEVVTSAQCVGNDIQETLLTVFGSKPLRFA